MQELSTATPTGTVSSSSSLLRVQGAVFRVGAQGKSQSLTREEDGDGEDNDGPSEVFTVRGIDLSISEGEVVAVVGPVASGKSTLLAGILGNASKDAGSVSVGVATRVTFAPQSAFILNATVKANVLFGRPYDDSIYRRALGATCLLADLRLLPAGDATEIGERGVTLSGGQKARVAVSQRRLSIASTSTTFNHSWFSSSLGFRPSPF